MKKVVILTAGYGEGHNSAANGLKSALAELGVQATVCDLFASTYGVWNDLSRKFYLALINRAPGVWRKVYELLHRTRLLEKSSFTLGKLRRSLARLISEQEPDVVVLTYPVYGFLLDELYPGDRPFRQFTVVTDSISVNSVWYRPRTDWFIVPNEATADVMRQAGVDPLKIRCLGFPVNPVFGRSGFERAVPGGDCKPQVLFMINCAHEKAPDLLRKLLAVEGVEYTVTAGRDAELLEQLKQVAAGLGRPVTFFGWTHEIPRLLMETHLLISKAGGATVQEALAAQTPMIISQVVPGQEEGNARLLVESGSGVIAQGEEAIAAAVESMFKDNAARWQQFHQSIMQLSRPRAALEIAQFVLQNAPHAPMKERA